MNKNFIHEAPSLIPDGGKERVLVCLSTDFLDEKSIFIASRLSKSLNADFLAVYFSRENPASKNTEDTSFLEQNLKLAESLGASAEPLEGEDAIFSIADYCRTGKITHLVINPYCLKFPVYLFSFQPIHRLHSLLPDVNLHVVSGPAKKAEPKKKNPPDKERWLRLLSEALKIVTIMGLATLVGLAIDKAGFDEDSIIPIYSLAVLICSLVTQSWISALISTPISILLFNFLFAQPVGTLTMYHSRNVITYLAMFITSVTIGFLVNTMKNQSARYAASARQTRILLDASETLQKNQDPDEISKILCRQIRDLTKKNVVYFHVSDNVPQSPALYQDQSQPKINVQDFRKEKEAIVWAIKHQSPAGSACSAFGTSNWKYYPCIANSKCLGVLAIQLDGHPLAKMENGVIRSLTNKYALAYENMLLTRQMEEARLKMENEKLRSDLLRAISHDLRTPLTAISGNIANLMETPENFDAQATQEMYKDIYYNSNWLVKLVENLLTASRLEEGSIAVQTSVQLLEELVAESLLQKRDFGIFHPFSTHFEEDLIMVNADASLIVQVLVNLLDNAQEYTPAGTPIEICAFTKDGMAFVEVRDTGGGVNAETQEKIFEAFNNGSRKIVDSHRSLGLGLYLCRKIIAAHGGQMYLKDNTPHGSIFGFSLPLADLSQLHC